MKIKILVLLILPLLISCKKKEEDSISIIGKWELKTAINGLTGIKTEYPSGNGTVHVFTKSSYEIYIDHKLIKSGTYKIVKEISIRSNAMGNRIIYDGHTDDIRSFVAIRDGNLSLFIDAFDGPGAIYKPI